jgi:hypothetical protein
MPGAHTVRYLMVGSLGRSFNQITTIDAWARSVKLWAERS